MKFLLVEDNPADARLIHEMLKDSSTGTFQFHHLARLDRALERLRQETFDVVLLDLGLPDGQGMQTLTLTQKASTGVPIVVLTGLDDQRMALEAVRAGAQDYLVKGRFESELLVRTIRYAIERKRAEEQIRAWNSNLERRVAERTAQLQKANDELVKEIVERRRAEAERDRLAQQRQLALNAAQLGWWHYDTLTKISNFDERYSEIFGIPGKQCPNEEILARLHPDDLPGVWAEVEAALDPSNPKPYSTEYRIKLPDGSMRWVEAHGVASFEGEGKARRATSFVGTVQDITDRKCAEDALIRSEKLASMGRMAATVAHEINNPLAAVMNSLYLARTSPALPEAVQHYLEVADEELRRISHISRQALGFYRESVTPATVSVKEILDSVVDLWKAKIKAKHAHIAKDCDGQLHVVAVAGELRQVMSNLLANSLDAIPDHGTIKLRVSTFSTHGGGKLCVRVTVADNGTGIDPSVRPHIFEPLVTTKSVGTGLGLWVSKHIIQKHGGSIRVHSRTNGDPRGTTFSIVLPLDATHTASEQVLKSARAK